jgi:hypothetical protein
MPTPTFWNTAMTEPKRQFRFFIRFGQMGDGPTFACKTVSKLKAQLDSTPHKFLNHTFNYPNRVIWQPISVSLVDMVQPDMQATFLGVLRQAGYTWPEDLDSASTNITKAQATSPFDKVTITQTGRPLPVGGIGGNTAAFAEADVIDEWELHNAFMGGTIDFGGELSYEQDGMVEVKFDLIYDYAYMTKAGGQADGWAPAAADGVSATFASSLDDG